MIHLSLLKIVGVFLFVGLFYLSLFASMQKTWAVTCSQGPNGYAAWCSGAYGCASGPNREVRTQNCINYCNQCGQCPCPAAPPPPPACSFPGTCQYAGCGAGGYMNATCGNPYMNCCIPPNACTGTPGGVCVGASSGGVAPCPAGKSYNTSLSCNSFYLVCCTGGGAGGGPGGGGPGGGPPPPPPTYNVTGRVYQAIAGNPGVGGVKVDMIVRSTGRVYESQYTNGNGNYAIVGYLAGNYAVRVNVPGSYTNTTPTTVNISFGPSRTVNFGIVRLYTISGNVFNDVNKNRVKDGGEANVSGISMSASGGNLAVNSGAGTYTITNLLAGTYNVYYTTSPLPAGYFMTWPRNGNPSPFLQITVGPNCGNNVQTYGLTCNNGDVSNANFGISNSEPWWQSYGLNIRIDDGFDDKIPINPLYPPYASVSDQVNGF